MGEETTAHSTKYFEDMQATIKKKGGGLARIFDEIVPEFGRIRYIPQIWGHSPCQMFVDMCRGKVKNGGLRSELER